MKSIRLVTVVMMLAGCAAHSTSPPRGDATTNPTTTTSPTVDYHALSASGAEMATTEQGRQFLKYLVQCALPEGQGAYAVIDGTRYQFAGAMGLAPQWLSRPMTEDEQRWVSAGILARTNLFGRHVIISMRHPNAPFECLLASPEEIRDFTICEGDFFGNLFADPPIACVTVRVGTEIDAAHEPLDGKPISRCGFVVTGRTNDPDAHTFRGVRYDQFIRVYLKPGMSSVQP